MPIYEYTCKACDRSFEELILRASDEDDVRCPKCKGKKVAKRMSRPAILWRMKGNASPAKLLPPPTQPMTTSG